MIALESNVSGESNGIFFHHEDGILSRSSNDLQCQNAESISECLVIDAGPFKEA
ncbi:hypothetical protein BD410DRAFT_789729 [Rickenella mellea]|uniref:Uncharacterized protein n=1 Tax=Rickenella mellea TaxID=50990 RepID=A0A4Y7Q256_9AGAM|nr:hypothetical protein BD410DRAFT_789729 [Rickenella mellea]